MPMNIHGYVVVVAQQLRLQHKTKSKFICCYCRCCLPLLLFFLLRLIVFCLLYFVWSFVISYIFKLQNIIMTSINSFWWYLFYDYINKSVWNLLRFLTGWSNIRNNVLESKFYIRVYSIYGNDFLFYTYDRVHHAHQLKRKRLTRKHDAIELLDCVHLKFAPNISFSSKLNASFTSDKKSVLERHWIR